MATVVALGKGEEFIQMRMRQRLWAIYRVEEEIKYGQNIDGFKSN